jgi:S-adenosylmethionine:tRNA ribosyltransferase-isomerase
MLISPANWVILRDQHNSMTPDNPSVTNIRIEDFSYDLPPGRIAAYPLPQRDRSRLLVVRQETIEEIVFGHIDRQLPEGSLMVLNNTRVVQARLEFFKETGARIEIFCLHPLHPVQDVHLALGQSSPVTWQCLVGNAKKWKTGSLELHDPVSGLRLQAHKQSRDGQEFDITFSWEPAHLSFGELLELAGKTPLPPYITRPAEQQDKTTYQTVFARDDGSVAAPTAGLHFTPEVFEKLQQKDIQSRFVTLHVGAGTFKPVSTPTIGDHQMHSEQISVERSLLKALASHNGALVSVGTTSMRTLESLFWLGAKLLRGYRPQDMHHKVEQWEPYQTLVVPEPKRAFEAILQWMDLNNTGVLQGETALIIVPGYHFKVVDILVTNFHQPKSTLLLLVAAFAGPRWKEAYRYALDNGFRFLSYGDSCLFFRNHLYANAKNSQ